MAARKCPVCHCAAGKEATFCKKCGAKLDDPATPEPEMETFGETFLDGLEETARALGGGKAAEAGPTEEGKEVNPALETPAALSVPTVPAGSRAYRLQVMNGPAAGRTVRLEGTVSVMVGSGSEADLHLRDDCLSRRHATFRLVGSNRLCVRDEESTNGVLIQVVGERQLTAGDLVVLGNTVLRVYEET